MSKEQLVQNIATILLQAREEIRANMRTQGINASGRTSAALQVVQRGSKIQLIKAEGQNAPFQTLQYGRRGGNVPRGFYDIILQWSRDKGLPFSSERERGTFAYIVSRKIAREGTQRNKRPNTQVFSEPIERAVESVSTEAKKYVLGAIKAALQQGFS